MTNVTPIRGPGFPVFDRFLIILEGCWYILTRDQLRWAYRTSDWRTTVKAIGKRANRTPDPFGIWGGYTNDDSIYKIKDGAVDPKEELRIMDAEEAAGRSAFFGPWGEFPWEVTI